MHRYAVIFEHPDSAENWSAFVPDLPGCVSVGDSFDECRENIQEAITFHLQGMREDGEPIPAPSTRVDYAEVA